MQGRVLTHCGTGGSGSAEQLSEDPVYPEPGPWATWESKGERKEIMWHLLPFFLEREVVQQSLYLRWR